MGYYYLMILSLVITISAELYVKVSYNKYNRVKNKKSISGLDAAQLILKENDVDNIYVVETSGVLTDHFDPNNNVVRLSKDNFHNESISAVSVAAHEIGHVIQHKENNKLIRIRTSLVPIVNFSSKLSYIVIVMGLVLSMTGLFYLGIAMMSTILLFQLVTLPVEIDASRKGLKYLKDFDILDSEELDQGKVVLKAAALTYVASLATTVIEILRLLYMNDDRR